MLRPELLYRNSQRVTAITAVSYSFTAVAASGRWQADGGREPLSHTESTDAEHKTFVSRPLSRSGGIDHTEHTGRGARGDADTPQGAAAWPDLAISLESSQSRFPSDASPSVDFGDSSAVVRGTGVRQCPCHWILVP